MIAEPGGWTVSILIMLPWVNKAIIVIIYNICNDDNLRLFSQGDHISINTALTEGPAGINTPA